ICDELIWPMIKDPPTEALPQAVLRLARKAVELRPYPPGYQTTLGMTLYRLGRFDEAARCLTANLKAKRRPYVATDLYFLSMCQWRLELPDKARESFDRANAAIDTAASLTDSERHEFARFRAETEKVLGIAPGR